MWFSLRSSDLAFTEESPFRVESEALLQAPPERVFSTLADADSWPRWFRGVRQVTWASPPPHGVGTKRRIVLPLLTADETMVAWEPGRRFAFSIDATTLPLMQRMLEDIRLEPSGDGTRVRWIAHYTPTPLARYLGALTRAIMRRMLAQGLRGLKAHLG
jgi:uncharacterized protein YndB with AHSA1/START domain